VKTSLISEMVNCIINKIQLLIIHMIYSKCRSGATMVDKNYINGRKGTKNEKTYYYYCNDYI
jgi:hypothetical protein